MSDEFETLVRECLARGYTHKENEKETLNVSLIEAMTDELMTMLDKPLPETVVLAYESFPSANKTVADLLDALIIREGKKWR